LGKNYSFCIALSLYKLHKKRILSSFSLRSGVLPLIFFPQVFQIHTIGNQSMDDSELTSKEKLREWIEAWLG